MARMRFFLLICSVAAVLIVPADAVPFQSNADSCAPTSAIPSINSAKLPDPFLSLDGKRITKKSDWDCRKQELSKMIQTTELGEKPPKPTNVTASLSGNKLTINCAEGGKSISFTVTISKPSGNGPFPAFIAHSTVSIPVPTGVATITFNNGDIAVDLKRGEGKFYTLYGKSHSAGALIAWAWGVSRIIDALEMTPEAGIDPKRVAVTGCSRYGKAALISGAFDDRVALTVPQESGCGGAACYRVSSQLKAAGTNIEGPTNLGGTNTNWLSTTFDSYTSATAINKLPHDHHEIMGLVAPRPLLVVENTIDWLGPESTYSCATAGKAIYTALGVPDKMGYTLSSGNNHCSFPAELQPDLTAYINKFLLNKDAETDFFKSKSKSTFDPKKYFDFVAPTLA